MQDALWLEFFNINYQANSVRYEFSKLLQRFNLDEYAQYKFESSIEEILQDGNLFRIVKSCNDFQQRYDYALFERIGCFDRELLNDAESYQNVRQQLAQIADRLWIHYKSLPDPASRIAFLKGKIDTGEIPTQVKSATYERFYGRLWQVFKN